MFPSMPELDEMIEKENPRLTDEESLQLWENVVPPWIADYHNHLLLSGASDFIGLTEMRKILGLKPPGWVQSESVWRGKAEMPSNLTIEEYYNAIETYGYYGNDMLLERNIKSGAAFVDQRYPFIRNTFRREFEKVIAGRVVDKKVIDELEMRYHTILTKLRLAFFTVQRMFKFDLNF
uniref:Uronate isomerase n=1 Tax=Caenorhabditis tropicalis TaxID=1561998 RepID=A0A1I7V0U8_9PELO